MLMIEHFVPNYYKVEKSSIGQILDVLDDGGSMDGCDPDWCAEVLERASQEDIDKVRERLERGGTRTAETEVFSNQNQLNYSEHITSRFDWMNTF
jgi:hypothetical protein